MLVTWIGFTGIRQGYIFADQFQSISVPEIKEKTEDDYKFVDVTTKYIVEQKLYLENELRLSGLAQRLKVTPQYLSFVINNVLNKSFYEYINEFRVKEVCSRIELGETKQLTLLSIALNSGFNSKATFNRFFKQHTGMNPSEFKKSMVKN